MSDTVDWPKLALLTLRDPKAAAAQIMGWKLERNTLWLMAAVVVIFSTILSTVSNILLPVPGPYAYFFAQPLRLFIIMAGLFFISFHILFRVGRSLGGTGEMNDLLSLLVWLQVLQTGAHLVILVSVFIVPFLTPFMQLIVVAATVWVTLNFVSDGLRLGSLIRAAVVCFLSFIAIVFAIALISTMIGLGVVGGSSGV